MTFEHATSLKKVKRVDYGTLQWAAELGGLYNLLSKLFMFLLSFLVGGGAHIFVGTHLMTKKEKEAPTLNRGQTQVHEEAKKVQEQCCLVVRMKLARWRLCPCFKPDERYRKVLNAQKNILGDFKVDRILKKIQALEGIVTEHLSLIHI